MTSVPRLTSDCHDDQVLRDFNSGRLVDVALEERVADHLSSCSACESRLRAIDDSDDVLLDLLRKPAPQIQVPHGSRSIDDPRGEWLESTRSIAKSHLESTDAGPARPVSISNDLPVRIDRYFVLRELGSGGFAKVYLAKDPDHDRLVAIKVPRSSCVDSQQRRELFLREARTAAALNHPHIVPVYDCRELSDGQCIVVMKYIEGRTLRDLMKSEKIEQRRVVELVAAIADALQCAHQHGIWHRDVKPANVLLDAAGQPLLSDFGLAILESQQHLLDAELAGTYPYMSPEQIRGESRLLDGRSDLWSVGVILYELLTRRRPFRGNSREQYSDDIQHRAPKPLRQIDPAISRHLDAVCVKCLMKDSADRFATAADLAAALRRPSRMIRTLAQWGAAALLLLAVLAAVVAAGLLDDGPEVQGIQQSVAATNTVDLRPLAWATLMPTDYYEQSDNGRLVVKSSASLCCLETHRPNSEHYQMSISGDFQHPMGIAGVAMGIHETSRSPEKYRCLILCVNVGFPQAGETWLSVEDCEIAVNEVRHMDFRERRTIATLKIDDRLQSSFVLRVEVDRERITRISFNDQPLPTLVEELRAVRVPAKTSCGVTALIHVVFHSINCQEM